MCGAVLLAKLLKKVLYALKIDNICFFAWSDSQIALAWINGRPNRWKTFVANRVVEVTSIINPKKWNHVSSTDNPADVASRGILPSEILNHTLWWNGPSWLSQSAQHWPKLNEIVQTNLEERAYIHSFPIFKCEDVFNGLLYKYSSIHKLKRVTAYCFRFIENIRKKTADKKQDTLSVCELSSALQFWIKHVQQREFLTEINCCKNDDELPRGNRLIPLNLFLDDNKVLRVGGRLRNSKYLGFDMKHPILLPSKHHLTTLIIADIHDDTLHAGPQLMLNILRKNYWIPKTRQVIRKFIHRCVFCYRQRGQTMNQIMGELPENRITSARPFIKSGVDYCGPFVLKTFRGRGNHKTYKGYIAVFVCLSTKAVHLEVVTDLTTEAFMAAFRRFISRRGKCLQIYSDNSSNFVGASGELLRLNNFLQSQSTQQKLADSASIMETDWHFIPPGSPHFGGLWEAAVKSTKFHLKRVIGSTSLTYEEMTTLLTQIEACLNSRPLCAITDDPSDLEPLTPGHFLVGESLLVIPEPDLSDVPLNRWQLIQRQTQNYVGIWNISINYNNAQNGVQSSQNLRITIWFY